LQSFIEANPEAGLEIDVERETVRFDGRTETVDLDESTKEALVEGIWDTTAVMQSNMDLVRETAADLPYVDGDGTGRPHDE
jgi:3-isopropylmalate/(R)-2-methylmalate dehydratase small subunit